MIKNIKTPLTKDITLGLKAGDSILLSGTIYTARDAAHGRMISLLNEGKELPINLENEIIYYVGPTPEKEGEVIGSAGPTTSYRMDSYAPRLLDLGLKGMIGKGARNEEVIEAIIRNKAIYFGAIGGAGALISKCIIGCEVIAYDYLGAEAIIIKVFLYTNIVDYDKFLTFSTKLNLTIMKLLEDKRIKLANPSADIYFSRK